jgi:hypothetical protein
MAIFASVGDECRRHRRRCREVAIGLGRGAVTFNAGGFDLDHPEDQVRQELLLRKRLMPRRCDYTALAADPTAVAKWIRPKLRSGPSGRAASVVLVDKDRYGVRPLHILSLVDQILYRVLADQIAPRLPEHLRRRPPIDEFRRASLDLVDEDDARYILHTDVTA